MSLLRTKNIDALIADSEAPGKRLNKIARALESDGSWYRSGYWLGHFHPDGNGGGR